MLRFLFLAASAAALTAAASAQTTPDVLDAKRVRGAIRHAGIYHVATGTWTRNASAAANFGPDVIYSNTAQSGYFDEVGSSGGQFPGSENFDEGILPSSANTNTPGNRDEYRVNCIEIGYCDFGSAASAWELKFYSSYTPCTFNGAPDATLTTGPLPTLGCWMVALDLSGGSEICLLADGGDGFDDDVDRDSFGWSFQYLGVGTHDAGFLLAGDPKTTDPNYVPGSNEPTDGTNTYFGPPSLCSPDEATGLWTQDFWYLEDPNDPDPGGPTGTSGCYFFGGYYTNYPCGGPHGTPFSSWHLELQADTGTCATCICGSSFCFSNPNSTGVNSSMAIAGSSSVNDDNVTLTASIPPNSVGFFLTSRIPGFIPNPAGSAGNLCLGNNIGRFQSLAANSGPAGIVEISTAAGQWSITSIPEPSGPYSAQPGDTAYFQCWHRDSTPGGAPTSNFTDGTMITWTM